MPRATLGGGRFAGCRKRRVYALDTQAIFCRRRHQPRQSGLKGTPRRSWRFQHGFTSYGRNRDRNYAPTWLGGAPKDMPPRPGTPEYDAFTKKQEAEANRDKSKDPPKSKAETPKLTQ